MRAIERALRELIKQRAKAEKDKKKGKVTKRAAMSTRSEAGLRAAHEMLSKRAKVIATAADRGWAVAAKYAEFK